MLIDEQLASSEPGPSPQTAAAAGCGVAFVGAAVAVVVATAEGLTSPFPPPHDAASRAAAITGRRKYVHLSNNNITGSPIVEINGRT
jgi:hypothetical protein